jgi:hypothetical protein
LSETAIEKVYLLFTRWLDNRYGHGINVVDFVLGFYAKILRYAVIAMCLDCFPPCGDALLGIRLISEGRGCFHEAFVYPARAFQPLVLLYHGDNGVTQSITRHNGKLWAVGNGQSLIWFGILQFELQQILDQDPH